MEEYENNQQPIENAQPVYEAPQPVYEAPVQPAPQPTHAAPQPVYQPAPQPQYQPPYQPAPQYAPTPVAAPSATSVMVMGILALALSEFGLIGLIFSIIARKKAKAYYAAYGAFTGQAKVGNILSKIALPVSIIMMVFWAIYIVFAIIAGIGIASQSGAYYRYGYLFASLF